MKASAMRSNGEQELPIPKKLQLYSFFMSPSAFSVRIALNLKGLDYEYKAINLSKSEQHRPEFLKINPLGFIPALVDDDMMLGDSFAIILYLEEKYPEHLLLPRDLGKRAINYQIESTLIGLELDGFINGTQPPPNKTLADNKPNPDYMLWFRQDQIIISAILGSCSDPIQPLIASALIAQEAWNRLNSSYASASRSRIISLKSKLVKNPKGTRTIPEFLQDMRAIADDLALAQSPVAEEDLLVHIISQLGDEYNSIVAAIKAASIVCSSIQPLIRIPIVRYIGENVGLDEQISWVNKHVGKGFAALEKLLKLHAGKYATGDEIFLADVLLAPYIVGYLQRYNFDMSEYPLLSRLAEAYMQVPAIQNAMPEKQPDFPSID